MLGKMVCHGVAQVFHSNIQITGNKFLNVSQSTTYQNMILDYERYTESQEDLFVTEMRLPSLDALMSQSLATWLQQPQANPQGL